MAVQGNLGYGSCRDIMTLILVSGFVGLEMFLEDTYLVPVLAHLF